MKSVRSTRAAALIAFIVITGLCATAVWQIGYGAALDASAQRGKASLALAVDGLSGQLQRHRDIAVLLADHPALRARLNAGEGASQAVAAQAGRLLLSVADKTGTLNIVLLDERGRVQAAAHPQSAVLVDHASSRYFHRAIGGALATSLAVTRSPHVRTYSFAAPIFSPGRAPLGVVLVTADVEGIETEWRGGPETVFFTDDRGLVFLSSRSELVLTRRPTDSELPVGQNALFPDAEPFPTVTSALRQTHEIWGLEGGRYLPKRALHLSQDVPVFGMKGHILVDAGPARRLAFLEAALAVALCAALAAFLALAAARKRQFRRRLDREAAAKVALEQRVAERTVALSQSNENLRHEVAERKEAEAALKTAQAHLVQAAKLSALGQMSAGISHELNQPLMAIRSFADNTGILIEKGRYDTATQNIGKISELSRRMGRIIKNLRAFARQEDAPLNDVDAVSVVQAVLEISERNRVRGGVSLDWQPPAEGSVWVRAGEVRLQQVVLNLVTNAIDAMEESDTRTLKIRISEDTDGTVSLSVGDTGPGIAQPERIFDPFYSTKQVKDGNSMGLGLSISYGLVQSFGGDIRGRNRSEGGAEFTVVLARAESEEAA